MYVFPEALLNGGEELSHDGGQHLRRRTVVLLADLIDGFFGTDAGILQKVVNGAVAHGVVGFDVALVLL